MNLRRQAVLLMTYVPENPDDALKVLAYAEDLVRDWMIRRGPSDVSRSRLHSISNVRTLPKGGDS